MALLSKPGLPQAYMALCNRILKDEKDFDETVNILLQSSINVIYLTECRV